MEYEEQLKEMEVEELRVEARKHTMALQATSLEDHSRYRYVENTLRMVNTELNRKAMLEKKNKKLDELCPTIAGLTRAMFTEDLTGEMQYAMLLDWMRSIVKGLKIRLPPLIFELEKSGSLIDTQIAIYGSLLEYHYKQVSPTIHPHVCNLPSLHEKRDVKIPHVIQAHAHKSEKYEVLRLVELLKVVNTPGFANLVIYDRANVGAMLKKMHKKCFRVVSQAENIHKARMVAGGNYITMIQEELPVFYEWLKCSFPEKAYFMPSYIEGLQVESWDIFADGGAGEG